MFFKGFRFGTILQLSIGPVCLYIFNCGSRGGFIYAEAAVISVFLVDCLYIFLAAAGASSLISDTKTKQILKLFGSVITALFGIFIILSSFGISILPGINIPDPIKSGNSFLTGLILTASNPMTIIFWGGIFSSKIDELGSEKIKIFLFSAGCAVSTLFFLTAVGITGSGFHYFLPPFVISILNIVIGATLIVFAVRSYFKKAGGTADGS